MPARSYPTDVRAAFPFRLDDSADSERVADLRRRVDDVTSRAQYGWGHTVDFGPFTQPGLLGEHYLQIVGLLDAWGWWPRDLTGLRVADIGAFTGGVSMVLADRGAATVYAIDEVPEHIEQCGLLVEAFGVGNVTTVETSLYRLGERIEEGSLDVALLSGVLYHLSDMLVGLMLCQRLLKPGGVLLLESNAVECFDHSYANYGRYFEGMWWQPTGLCMQDMSEHAGFDRADVRFYRPGRALARMVKPVEGRVPFKRGVNLDFADLRDDVSRTRDSALMAPAPDAHAEGAMLRRVAGIAGERAYRRLVEAGYRLVRAVRARRR